MGGLLFISDYSTRLTSMEKAGLLHKRVAKLQALSRFFPRVRFIGPDTQDYSQLFGHQASYERLPSTLAAAGPAGYMLLAPLACRCFRESDIYSLFIGAAVPALIGKRLYGKKVAIFFDWNWVEFSRVQKESWLERRAKRLIEGLALRYADCLLPTTRTLEAYLLSRGVEPERIFLLPNYVDTERFRPPEAKEPGNGRLKILSVGRLVTQKNYPLLLEAVSLLADLAPELTVVGWGPLKEEVLSLARRLRVDLHLVENVPNEGMPPYFQAADLFLMPSLIEGHPVALLEAMACGLPVVGTDVEGIRDVIEHGVSGLLCEQSAADVAAKVRQVAQEPDLARRLGQRAREQVVATCSFEALIRREAEIYRQVMGR